MLLNTFCNLAFMGNGFIQETHVEHSANTENEPKASYSLVHGSGLLCVVSNQFF